MKTKHLWLSLLLTFALLFCSCTTLFQRDSSSTEQTQAPVSPSSLFGKWYCADVQAVIELKAGNVYDYYNLVADDYAYATDVTTGQYTLSENKISIPLEADFSLELTYDAVMDVFGVDGLELSFSRVEILPVKLGTAEPQKFKGIWYGKDSKRVYDLHDDGTLDVYSIQAGYYTYSATESATYTIKDAIIEIQHENTDKPTELIYNSAKDSLSNFYGNTYVRVNELPTKHLTATFPNYAELDFSSITLGEYKNRDLTTSAKAYAALDIFESYFSANKGKSPVAITEERAAAYGDCVVIDYTGYLNDVAFAGGSAANQTISIVSNSGYIPGFVEGVIGHRMGETFKVPVTFPENYGNKDLAGKSVIFTMTLHTIYDLSISDEEIKSFSKDEFSTYADMLSYYVDAYRAQDIWSLLQKEATYTNLPAEAYTYFYYYYRDYYHSQAFSYGMEYETLLQYYGLTDAMLLEEAKNVALPYAIAQLIFNKEGLAENQEQYDKKYNEILEQYVKDAMEYFKYSEEDAKKFILENEANDLRATVVKELISEWLLEHNN